MDSSEKMINNVLSIVMVTLIIAVAACSYYLFNMNSETSSHNSYAALNTFAGEVLYDKVNFGTTFDINALDNMEVLDEYENVSFIRNDSTFYVVNDEELLMCEYKHIKEDGSVNYRYCDVNVDDNLILTIDFASLKFIK